MDQRWHASEAHKMEYGSARYITYESSAIMPALATRAGGETVELP